MAQVCSTGHATHAVGDGGFWRLPKRWSLGGAVVVAVILSAACSGGDKKPAATATPSPAATQAPTATPTPSPTPEPNKFDTTKAAALAKAMLPKAADLGAGWAITSQDDFKTDPLPTSPTCTASAAAQKAFDAALEVNRAGRSNVSMDRAAPGGALPSSASFQMYVFSDAKAATLPLTAFKALYDTDAFLKCFEEAIGSTAATVKVTKGTPSVNAPTGVVAVAYDITISAGGVSAAMRLETFAWTSSNALAGITLFGGKDVITPAFVTSAVTATQTAMGAAR
ncbi:MAG: hypothetical protein EPO65_04500 [Dehalococcoidia bacterium]|nr:MAG: hypothetical protein EPO65_04500 [Dehalococcoidia bacterium]